MNDIFHPLNTDIMPPRRMNNPLRYEPHPLCLLAAAEVRGMIESRSEWHQEVSRGKMFGVLVVERADHQAASGACELGYLAAYSGQLLGRSDWPGFVPAVFDYLQPDGYFKTHEREIDRLTAEIERLSSSAELKAAHSEQERLQRESATATERQRQAMAAAKLLRDRRRQSAFLSERDKAELIGESQFQKAELHRIKKHYRQLIEEQQALADRLEAEIEAKEQRRRQMSVDLQQWLFSQFTMTNYRGEQSSLLRIFADRGLAVPPSGSGECCEPKLLQYAFTHGLRPLCMAMFWIGESPQGEVRHDGHYYPACSGKCKPILQWMLPPEVTADDSERRFTMADLPVVYEDQDLIVVDKPSGMLSVPGKTAVSSVVELLDAHFGNSARALSVHRLDQATSGLLVVAKHPDAQRELQRMFENRMVEKRYLALIEGNLPADTPREGTIDLPLRPDLDDRPRQMADHKHGRKAVSHYRVLKEEDGRTLLELRPETGRTHQLRLHCAHKDGLGQPIVGDELYGKKGHRMMLHAYSLTFRNPFSGKLIKLKSDIGFS